MRFLYVLAGYFFIMAGIAQGVAMTVAALEKNFSDGRKQKVYLIGHRHLRPDNLPANLLHEDAALLVKEQTAVITEFFELIKKEATACLLLEATPLADEAKLNEIRLPSFYGKCFFEVNPAWCERNVASYIENEIFRQREINSVLYLGQETEGNEGVIIAEPKIFLDAALEALFMLYELKSFTHDNHIERYQAVRASSFTQCSPNKLIKTALDSIGHMTTVVKSVCAKLIDHENLQKAHDFLDYLSQQKKLWLSFKKAAAKYPYKSVADLVLGDIFEQKGYLAEVDMEELVSQMDSVNLLPTMDYAALDVILGEQAPSVVIANVGALHVIDLVWHLTREGYSVNYGAQLRCGGTVPLTLENYKQCYEQGLVRHLSVEELRLFLREARSAGSPAHDEL